MLIGFRKNDDRYFEGNYVNALRKINILCGLIVSGRLSRTEAVEIYGEIEREYKAGKPEKPELFKMIYENRIYRLCDQFCGNLSHEE